MNLAGVFPLHEAAVELGDAGDYRDHTRQVELPLTKEGAYLVVARGGDLHASGLIVISPLTLEVQEDSDTGHVHITVKDRTDDRCVRNAKITVTASGGGAPVVGQSDLRGVFAADGLSGTVTVIAQAEGEGRPARYAFYRGRTSLQPGESRARVSGGEPGQPVVPRISAGISLAKEDAMEKKINAALDAPVRLEVVEKPLQDVVDFLKDQYQIEIQIDERALGDMGIGSDTPITRSLKDVSLRSGLKLILRELDLTYAIRDEVLLITTPEEAESQLVTKAYPVGDLIRYRDEEGVEWADFDALIELITVTVAPTTWMDAGGAGSIEGASFNDSDLLIIAQTDDVHEEVAELLAMFRGLRAAERG